MKFRVVVAVLVALLGVMTLSCQSDVDKVVDWYEEQDVTMMGRFPTMATCDRNQQHYWRFAAEVEEVMNNYQRAITTVAQSGNRPGVQSLSDELIQYTQVRKAAFLRAARWSEEEYRVCAPWLVTRRDPETICNYAGDPAHASSYGHYGSLRYCIENSIPPFD